MTHNHWSHVVIILAMCWISSRLAVGTAVGSELPTSQYLPGNRILVGTVMEVRSDQVKVHTGKGQPRYLPMKVRKYKRLPPLKKSDLVEITVNDQNLLVDVHKAGESGHHRVIRGQLAGPLVTGHDKAVFRTLSGAKKCYSIRPVARSKMASIPVGAETIFLLDELDRVADAMISGTAVVHRAAELRLRKSPIKGNLRQVSGTILKPLMDNRVIIRTEAENVHSYEVCLLIRTKLAQLSISNVAVFLVNEENKMMDVAFVPQKKQTPM